MTEPDCPNYKHCKLVNTTTLPVEEEKRQRYMRDYCQQGKERWGDCARYTTRMELFFCPDFVMPDTPLTTREILEKYDEIEYGIKPKLTKA